MDTVSCKHCHGISSVSSNTQVIRCHSCSRIISVGHKNQESAALSCGSSSRYCLNFCSKPSRSLSLSPITRLEPPAKEKRALLCGVSYKGQKHKLKGTTQDVLNMQKMLLNNNFSSDAILILAGNFSETHELSGEIHKCGFLNRMKLQKRNNITIQQGKTS